MSASNEWEHLQSVLMRVHNHAVRAGFKEDIPDNELNTPEGALKYACLIKDSDSAVMSLIRMYLFHSVRTGTNLEELMYGIPVTQFQEILRFTPQLQLHFHETKQSQQARGSKFPHRVRVSMRLLEIDLENDRTLQNRLAQRIQSAFPQSYRYKTGRTIYTYVDKSIGIRFKIAAYDMGEARELITKALSLLDKPEWRTPSWGLLSINEKPNKNYALDEKKRILGETVLLPKNRTIANTALRKIELHIYGRDPEILLERPKQA